MAKRKIKLSAIYTGAVSLLLLLIPAMEVNAEEYFTLNHGDLERPTGYREWIYVGTPVTPNDLNNGKASFPEFHNVYIDPKSWAHWKSTGKFRDGTILIKELVSVGAKSAVSGNGYFQGDFVGLEATIKSKKHFPNEPGNWAYYSFSTPDHKTLTTVSKPFPTASCNACHAASAADDFVFTQYYPVLREGKAAGEAATGGKSSVLTRKMEK
ncbi:MAG: cytochrome P460 family protein [Photobacterium frigidiphilum]|uniref:cytochrome P460 family protein n=1 Tax=Photobacterium frigidiphilum TaxID=264736 RepID=UPI0030017CC7